MQPDLEPHFGPEDLAARANLSRETLSRFKLYASMLEDWNARQNLVSRASLEQLWLRHFWDSAQLAEFISPDSWKPMIAGFWNDFLSRTFDNRGEIWPG